MGNASSVQLDGEASAGVSQHQPLDTSVHSSTKSWATMDHSISGPWSFLVKEEVQCLCEGGRNCSHENPARQKAPNAIAGLNSSWVGDQVLAMARPWQENVLKHDVVSQFKQQNIGMILNLQEVGEHESCGPGNMAVSGFTYNPETFMAAKIGVYNISWRDMGVPTLEKMMDIVQIMHYTTSVECRKVAVHCHAGLGRTGLAIACFLLASGQAPSAPKAVEMVRAARPGSLQTQTQVMFVSIFEQYLQHLRCMFKVADLKHLSLGNTNYIVTKVCSRISRSMSGLRQVNSAGTPDALAVAAAALGPLAFTPSGSGGSSAPSSATAAKAAAHSQPDWASATYDVMSPSEAAQLAATPAEAAANAALNLGQGAGGAGSGQEGLVMHARRMSGGGSMKLVSNLKAIDEEGDKPVHVIQTDSAVTEVYGHGLTIIRATDSVKKMYANPVGAKAPEQPAGSDQQLPTAHDLGLDRQLPWNDKFAIRPEAFKAEGWLPDPPASYLEALRRQQRLLHGQERRRCLHQHKLVRAAAKALAAAAEAYKTAPEHKDAAEPPRVSTAGPPSPPFKRMHSRSRSNAAAIDLLAVTGSLSPSSSGVPHADGQKELHRSPSANGILQSTGAGSPAAAGVSAISSGSPGAGLLSKQQQQQQLGSSSPGTAAATSASGGVPAPDSAAALLPGLHLGPPGTNPVPCSSNGGNISRTTSGARKLARQGSSAKGRKSAHSPAGAAATAAGASGDFFLSTDGSSAAAQGSGCITGNGTSASGGVVPSCTQLLAGCCAPSFAVGLLIALLYKGRFPEEFEGQWSACPRLKALGLDEGHAVCQALQDVKLAVNAGSYGPLETASGAVAVCVLADWFEGFTEEAFSENTLELLVDDAESMLAEALAAATNARAQEDQQQQPQPEQQGGGRSSSVGQVSGAPPAHLPPLHLSAMPPQNPNQAEDEATALARKAAARAVCCALAPYEQDLCLLLAAVLRHARHASLDDPRLQELGLNYSNSGSHPSGSGRLSGGGAGASGSGSSSQAAAAVEAQVDAAMAVLYRLVAGWLLGPLALACVPALEAVAAFLHYLTVDDTAYGCLLQAIQQGVRRARTAPAGGLADASDSVNVAPGSNPNSPRIQQQQQNMDRLEKLKSRLLGAGSSFKLKPLSAYYKQHKQNMSMRAGPGVKFADEPPANLVGVGTAGASAVAAQHGIGKSKLRHASSSPELANMQQQQQGGAACAKHAKSKLGASASFHESVHSAEGDQPVQGLATSPEPKHGCAASWTSMLTHKLHSMSSKKHQLPELPAEPDVQQQPQQKQQQQQQGLEVQQVAAAGVEQKIVSAHPAHAQHHQQQQQLSPGASSCGDSISELIHAGNCQELCVGQQGQVQEEGHMSEELAVLTGQPLTKVSEESSQHSALGALDSPPRSVSPELSPSAAARRNGGRGSSNGSAKQQQPLHLRLAPGLQRNSMEAGSDGGSSFTNSPCSSMGSITGLIFGAQLHQGYQLQHAGQQTGQHTAHSSSTGTSSGSGLGSSLGPSSVVTMPPGSVPSSSGPCIGSQRASGNGAVLRPSSAAAATAAAGGNVTAGAVGAEAGPGGASVAISGELSVQSSHAVSVSAMSELQLQSSMSKVSVTGPSSRTRTVSR